MEEDQEATGELKLPDKTIYVNYFDDITDGKAKMFMKVLADILVQQKPECIYLCFSSNGGSVNAGITLYNFLRALPVRIVMHNIGSIDSVATIIFLAGDERYAAPHTTFSFHGVAAGFGKDTRLKYADLRERVSQVEQDEIKLAGIMVENTKMENDEIKELFLKGESKPLVFAVGKGIINEVRKFVIPANKYLMSINFP